MLRHRQRQGLGRRQAKVKPAQDPADKTMGDDDPHAALILLAEPGRQTPGKRIVILAAGRTEPP